MVLADTRRLGDCFPSIDYFENRRLPFIVAVNCFDGAPHYDPADVQMALNLDPGYRRSCATPAGGTRSSRS